MSTIETRREASSPEPLVINGVEHPFFCRAGVAFGVEGKEEILARNLENVFVELSLGANLVAVKLNSTEDPFDPPHAMYRNPAIPEDVLHNVFSALEAVHPQHFDANTELSRILPTDCHIAVRSVLKDTGNGYTVKPL